MKYYKNPEWIQRWIGPFIIAVVAVAGLIWSWGTWPDVLIDFGRELYVPWRLTEGDVLYRDIIWYHGPLSPYILALWFYCFGVSLQSTVILNLFVIAGVLCLLYWMFLQMAGRCSATLSCLTFLSVFAFSQFVDIGNYNWVCPYALTATHGVSLSLLSFYLLFHFAKSLRFVWIGSSGLVIGLVFLTKPDIFLAALAGNIAGIVAILWLKSTDCRFVLKTCLVWISLAVVPIGITYILFSLVVPSNDALYAVMGSWILVFKSCNTEGMFIKFNMGTLNPMENIIIILKWIGWYVLIFAPAIGLSLTCRRLKAPPMRLAIITFLLLSCVLLLWQWQMITWYNISRPWQVFMLLLGLIVFYKIIFRRIHDEKEHPATILRFTMVVFSFVLLAKIILHVRIEHYGFVLALPSTLMVIAALWDWIPRSLIKFGFQPVIFRGAVLAAWLVTITVYIDISDNFFSNKKCVVGTGADAFRSDARGYFVNKAIKILNESVKPGDTLAVLPEGIMLNYLLRMKSPVPYTQYISPDMDYYGEDRMVESFKNSPPDWIVLIHRDESEFGPRFFGQDYGKSLWDWIGKNYVFNARIGAMPFSSNYFGILIGEKIP